MKNKKNPSRLDGRTAGELRPLRIERGVAPAAAGSVLIHMGNTRVICGVTVEAEVPRWMRQKKVAGGWLTAEYAMLPYCSPERARREVASGKVSGRTSEIQRLIGRSLRSVVDLEALGERTLWVDCDVLQADGGTRTASITGAWIALRMAIDRLLADGTLKDDPIREAVAAISVGVVDGAPMLDLCYEEDVRAEVDMNVVMTASGKLIEVQATAEAEPFGRKTFDQLMGLAESGISRLLGLSTGKRAATKS